MPLSYDKAYPHVEPFYQDTERSGGGRLSYIENSDYAWNAEQDSTKNLTSHISHSALIGGLSFIGMKAFKQNTQTALLHSAIIGASAFLYMGLFGHGLPTELRGPLVQRGDE